MVGSPRVVEFELLVLDFGEKLIMEHFRRNFARQGDSLEEEVRFDRQRIEALSDHRTKMILTFNLTQKLLIQA